MEEKREADTKYALYIFCKGIRTNVKDEPEEYFTKDRALFVFYGKSLKEMQDVCTKEVDKAGVFIEYCKDNLILVHKDSKQPVYFSYRNYKRCVVIMGKYKPDIFINLFDEYTKQELEYSILKERKLNNINKEHECTICVETISKGEVTSRKIVIPQYSSFMEAIQRVYDSSSKEEMYPSAYYLDKEEIIYPVWETKTGDNDYIRKVIYPFNSVPRNDINELVNIELKPINVNRFGSMQYSKDEEKVTPIKRPDWDEYFLDVAKAISARSTCLRRRYGAIIVDKNKAIISTGYNGSPIGRVNCSDIGKCRRNELKIKKGERYELCEAVHAEQNAIINGTKMRMKDSTMYIYGTNVSDSTIASGEPCLICDKMIANAGIEKVIYYDKDHNKIVNSTNPIQIKSDDIIIATRKETDKISNAIEVKALVSTSGALFINPCYHKFIMKIDDLEKFKKLLEKNFGRTFPDSDYYQISDTKYRNVTCVTEIWFEYEQVKSKKKGKTAESIMNSMIKLLFNYGKRYTELTSALNDDKYSNKYIIMHLDSLSSLECCVVVFRSKDKNNKPAIYSYELTTREDMIEFIKNIPYEVIWLKDDNNLPVIHITTHDAEVAIKFYYVSKELLSSDGYGYTYSNIVDNKYLIKELQSYASEKTSGKVVSIEVFKYDKPVTNDICEYKFCVNRSTQEAFINWLNNTIELLNVNKVSDIEDVYNYRSSKLKLSVNVREVDDLRKESYHSIFAPSNINYMIFNTRLMISMNNDIVNLKSRPVVISLLNPNMFNSIIGTVIIHQNEVDSFIGSLFESINKEYGLTIQAATSSSSDKEEEKMDVTLMINKTTNMILSMRMTNDFASFLISERSVSIMDEIIKSYMNTIKTDKKRLTFPTLMRSKIGEIGITDFESFYRVLVTMIDTTGKNCGTQVHELMKPLTVNRFLTNAYEILEKSGFKKTSSINLLNEVATFDNEKRNLKISISVKNVKILTGNEATSADDDIKTISLYPDKITETNRLNTLIKYLSDLVKEKEDACKVSVWCTVDYIDSTSVIVSKAFKDKLLNDINALLPNNLEYDSQLHKEKNVDGYVSYLGNEKFNIGIDDIKTYVCASYQESYNKVQSYIKSKIIESEDKLKKDKNSKPIKQYRIEIKQLDVNSERIVSSSVNGNILYDRTLNSLIKRISTFLHYSSYTLYNSKEETEVKWYKFISDKEMKNVKLVINKITDKVDDSNNDEERSNRIYDLFVNMMHKKKKY